MAQQMENRVGFWSRCLALAVDFTFIIFIAFGVGGLLGGLLGEGGAIPPAHPTTMGGSPTTTPGLEFGNSLDFFPGETVVVPLVWLLYFLPEALTGLTTGKLLLGLRALREDGTVGDRRFYLTRFAAKHHPSALMLLGGLLEALWGGSVSGAGGMISAGKVVAVAANLLLLGLFIGYFKCLGPRMQAFHDLLTKSAVYRVKRRVRQSA